MAPDPRETQWIQSNKTIDLREYLKILKRRKWLIAGTLFLVVAATALVSWRMTPVM